MLIFSYASLDQNARIVVLIMAESIKIRPYQFKPTDVSLSAWEQSIGVSARNVRHFRWHKISVMLRDDRNRPVTDRTQGKYSVHNGT